MFLSEAERKYDFHNVKRHLEESLKDRNISDTQKQILREEFEQLRKKVMKAAYAVAYRSHDRLYPVVSHYSHSKYIKEKEEVKRGLRKRASGMICHYYTAKGAMFK